MTDDEAALAAAESALAGLRRTHLIHSWAPAADGFVVTVGRGTVRLAPLDAGGVLQLAGNLRRDRVAVVGRGYPMGHRTTRYELSDGRFADRGESRLGRYLPEYPYTVYLPGGDPSGSAAVEFAARTKVEALGLAGAVRVRGGCTRCGSDRPLHVRHWQPDPTIPCPGCGASATVAVVLHCRGCRQPIEQNTARSELPFRSAWLHSATGKPRCGVGDGRRARSGQEPVARP